MTQDQIIEIIHKQKEYFNNGKTLDIKFRKEQLRKLYDAVKKYETEICKALKADFRSLPKYDER